MRKEPLLFHFLRLLLWGGSILFLSMLYWSSNLMEEKLKQIDQKIDRLEELVKRAPPPSLNSKPSIPSQPLSSTSRSWIDASLPNLLEEDPFYTTTLPKLLGEDFKPHGVLHFDQLGKPVNLHPFSNWAFITAWQRQCNVAVAKNQFGKFETFAPDMAIKVEERKTSDGKGVEFWVHLRDGVFWAPLEQRFFPEGLSLSPHFFEAHQVTAEDFKFYFDALMNPYVQEAGAVASRTYYDDIEEIRVIDPLTFVVRWKSYEVKGPDGKIEYRPKYIAKQLTGGLMPLARWVYQYFPDGSKIVEEDSALNTYRTHSIWAQNFNQHWAKNVIVSCGGWLFDGMTEREIRFKRNENHYFPLEVLVESSETYFKETQEAIWEDFKAGKIDTYELRPDQLIELERFLQSRQYLKQVESGSKIERLDYVARSYSYLGWNEARPFFKSAKVRQALTMAIDRNRILTHYLNGMGVEMAIPFYPYSPSYDASIKPWPFDLQRARFLLQEEGWYDSDNDGVIDKEIEGVRVPFSFSLTYYVKNPMSKSICEYVATALKEVGIACRLNGVDITDLTAAFEGKDFDVIALGWSLGSPPEEIGQLWSSSGAKQKGSSNAIGFMNEEVDQIISQLEYESDFQKRNALYHRFGKIFYEEAPYTLLYTPKVALLYRDHLQNLFLPIARQDLVPHANVAEPEMGVVFIAPHGGQKG